MFIPKCKKCGGKVISAYTNIEIETNGVLKTVTNTPAKKCSKCGHIIVDDITMEKAKQYANDYPANTIVPPVNIAAQDEFGDEKDDLSDMSDEELRQAIYELEDTTMLRLGQMSREELEKEYDGIEVDMDE